MGLFKRISDIISANLGELAEQYEDPEKMLKQAIREMEESIEKATQDTAKTLANEKRLAKELAHNQNESLRWQERAEQAVKSGDDDLARKALSRKAEHEKLSVALRDQMTAVSDATQTLRHQLDGMKAKLSEAKRNLATLAARQKAANVRKKAYTSVPEGHEIGLNDEAFQKFDRLRDKVEMAEAEAEALAELRGADFPSAAERVEGAQEQDLDIEEQLQKLKDQSQE